ncbi:MAG: VIT1/CCC1 transporter family protein [Candidatus Heimdallarchaeota archaeon]|nr:VIT1/CCC1 transporter family protein [Candidatus Heimdallarchaeota archaeon]
MTVEHEHPPEFEEHMSYRNYMRDLILGGNDGLVSIFALVLGVAGGGLLPRVIFLAGAAGAIAGAISMAIGEYLSTKSQEQVYDAEMEMERRHIEHHLDHEKEELYEFYRAKGFQGAILDEIVETIASDPEILLKEMMMAEFGVLEDQRRSPLMATIIVGIAFAIGSLPPILPFLFATSTFQGVMFSSIFSITGLFIVGGFKARITRTSILKDGMENLTLGTLGAIITYIIGFFIGINI